MFLISNVTFLLRDESLSKGQHLLIFQLFSAALGAVVIRGSAFSSTVITT